jgi:hypothetical protein
MEAFHYSKKTGGGAGGRHYFLLRCGQDISLQAIKRFLTGFSGLDAAAQAVSDAWSSNSLEWPDVNVDETRCLCINVNGFTPSLLILTYSSQLLHMD